MTPNDLLKRSTRRPRWRVPTIVLALCASGCAAEQRSLEPHPCSEAWFHSIETRIRTDDGQGHGPDVASDDWKSVIEFKLGIRGNSSVPDRQSSDWCEFIDEYITRNNA